MKLLIKPRVGTDRALNNWAENFLIFVLRVVTCVEKKRERGVTITCAGDSEIKGLANSGIY